MVTAMEKAGSRKTKLGKREPIIKKIARVTAYAMVVSLGAAGVFAHSVYADVKDAALGAGTELGKLGDVGSKRALSLNGQEIHVASSFDKRTVGEVLDFAEQGCRDGSSGLLEVFDGLDEKAKKNLPPTFSRSDAAGVMREEKNGEGVVACLVADEPGSQATSSSYVTRAREFLRTGDLSAMGKLRYVYAKPSGDGSHLVTAWTNGSFNLYALFPNGTDAPGNDSKDVPRPERSVRLLTAGADGMPYAVRMYDSELRSADVMKGYDAELLKRGWERVETPPDEPGARAYAKDGADLLVLAEPHRERTIVSLVETGVR